MNVRDRSKPHRKTIRLPEWDYRTAAYYFITICTHRRQCFFDDPILCEIAANAWLYIPEQPRFRHVAIDESVIMPNHVHGIMQIVIDPETATHPQPSQRPPSGSIGAIVGNYKMLVSKRVKAALNASGTGLKVWQRGYWERIIRNERELNATRKYIRENPIYWQEDRDNLEKLLNKMHYVDGSQKYPANHGR